MVYTTGVESREFDWDEPEAVEGNLQHIARHGVSQVDWEQAFDDPDALAQPANVRGLEERGVLVGATAAGRILFLVYLVRDERIRPVTGYPAGRALRELYLTLKGG